VERVVEQEPRGDDGGRGAAELQPVGTVPVQRPEEDARRVAGRERARLREREDGRRGRRAILGADGRGGEK
jgi:hypothetical protein